MITRFSTQRVPVPSRKDAVEAIFGTHVQASVDFAAGEAVAIDMRLRALGGIHLVHIDASPLRLVTPACTSDMVYLGITRSGGGILDASGASRAVKAGDVNVLSRSRRSTTIVAEPSSILSIAIPRAYLRPRLVSSDALLPSAHLSGPAAQLLDSYAMTLIGASGDTTAEEDAVFGRHLVDLVVLMLDGRRSDVEPGGQGVRAARRQAIKADIAACLGLPELSLAWMARRHGISPSYLRVLFYDEGTSFTDHVLGARLDYARDLLRDSRFETRTIAALALTAGFGDISWFNQAFRRRFGLTPSDLRGQLTRQ